MEFLPQLITLGSVVLLACISPGPDFIAVTSHALSGRRAGLGAAIGVSVACLVWSSLAMFGLGLLLARIAWLYEVVRIAGAVYLMYLGGKMLLSAWKMRGVKAPELSGFRAETSIKFGRGLRNGLLVGLTNPKSAAFFGSLFVTVLPVAAPMWVHGVTLAIVLGVATGWFCLLSVLFSSRAIQRVYRNLRNYIDTLMGAILVAIGVRLASNS